MNNNCMNCNLSYQLKQYQKRLNNLIADKNMNLLDDEIIRLSQEIDQLLLKCITCSKYANLLGESNLIYIYMVHAYMNRTNNINKSKST